MKNNNVPAIRFKGFTDAWEQRKLGEIGKTYSGLSGKIKEDFGHGEGAYVTYLNVYQNAISDISNVDKVEIDNKQTQVKYGDIFFTTSSETPEEVGMTSVWLGNEEHTYLNSFCFGYRIKVECDFIFFAYMLRSDVFRKKIMLLGQGISRYNISKNRVMDLAIYFPSLEEQKRIGALCLSIDTLITLHQRKLDKLQALKKALLQKLFPKNGSEYPEVRFKGFIDAWEQLTLGSLGEYKKGPFGSAITKAMFVPKGENTVKIYEQQNAIYKDASLARYYVSQDKAEELKNFEAGPGDIIVSCAGTIGEVYELPSDADKGIFNQALMRVRVDVVTLDKNFYLQILPNVLDSLINKYSNGSAIKNIPPFATLKNHKVLIPFVKEQKKISGLLVNLDKVIDLEKRELELLKETKKAFLQKLFV